MNTAGYDDGDRPPCPRCGEDGGGEYCCVSCAACGAVVACDLVGEALICDDCMRIARDYDPDDPFTDRWCP